MAKQLLNRSLKEGAELVISYRSDKEGAEEVLDSIQKVGEKARAFYADFSTHEGVEIEGREVETNMTKLHCF